MSQSSSWPIVICNEHTHPWFRAFNAWDVENQLLIKGDEKMLKKVKLAIMKAHYLPLKDPELEKLVDNLLNYGCIGGRMIKIFIDRKDRVILFSDTDEIELSKKEIEQFALFEYKVLPLIDNRACGIPTRYIL